MFSRCTCDQDLLKEVPLLRNCLSALRQNLFLRTSLLSTLFHTRCLLDLPLIDACLVNLLTAPRNLHLRFLDSIMQRRIACDSENLKNDISNAHSTQCHMQPYEFSPLMIWELWLLKPTKLRKIFKMVNNPKTYLDIWHGRYVYMLTPKTSGRLHA